MRWRTANLTRASFPPGPAGDAGWRLARGIDPVLALLDWLGDETGLDVAVGQARQAVSVTAGMLRRNLPIAGRQLGLIMGAYRARQGHLCRGHADTWPAHRDEDPAIWQALAAGETGPRAGGKELPEVLGLSLDRVMVMHGGVADVRVSERRLRYWAFGRSESYRHALLRPSSGKGYEWLWVVAYLGAGLGLLSSIMADQTTGHWGFAYLLLMLRRSGLGERPIPRRRLRRDPLAGPVPRIVVVGPERETAGLWVSLVMHLVAAAHQAEDARGGTVLDDTWPAVEEMLHGKLPEQPRSLTFRLQRGDGSRVRFVQTECPAGEEPDALQRRILDAADQVWAVLPAGADADAYLRSIAGAVPPARITLVQDDPSAAGLAVEAPAGPAGRRLRANLGELRRRYLAREMPPDSGAGMVEWLLAGVAAETPLVLPAALDSEPAGACQHPETASEQARATRPLSR